MNLKYVTRLALTLIALGAVSASVGGLAPVRAAGALSATPLDGFRFVGDAEQMRLLNKPGPAPAVSMLSNHEYYYSLIVRRTADGQVEEHLHWIDFMAVLAGQVDLTYGGHRVGGKALGNGEFLGGHIVHGTKIHLKTGDYVEIPPGVPHLMTAPKGLRYLVVKVRV